MKTDMRRARASLAERLASNALTSGMEVRAHGDNLIVARPTEGPDRDDRVRLTRLGASSWGLSVKRHTGRWERTPFAGSMSEMTDVIWSFLQHVVAPT